MTSEIVDAFSKLRRDQPDRPLIFLPARQSARTARDLASAADRFAAALAAVDPDGVVISAVGSAPALFSILLACRARNQPLLALDHAATDGEIEELAATFGAVAVFASEHRSIGCDDAVTVDEGCALIRRAQANCRIDCRGAAILKLTSGSTGAPRATLTPESAIVGDGRRLAEAMDIRASDVQIAAIPLAHSYGLGNLVMPLLLNGTAISLRDAFVPQRIPDDARAVGARHLPGAPFMFAHWIDHPPEHGWPFTLTQLVSAGAPLEPETAARFRAAFSVKVRPFYGTSETGGIAFDDSDHPARPGFVGRTLPGVDVILCDVADGEPGRVHVRSNAVSDGYVNDRDHGAFVDGGFLTGDLASIDHDGITLVGRVSSFVNVAGRKVQPDEVERVLREFPGISDAGVIGISERQRGEQLAACLVVDGVRPSIVALRTFCGARLPAYKIPRWFVFADRMPRTGRGKVDTAVVRDLVQQRMAADGML